MRTGKREKSKKVLKNPGKIETLMLPTLWIKEDENGNLYAVETEYTRKYLYGKE